MAKKKKRKAKKKPKAEEDKPLETEKKIEIEEVEIDYKTEMIKSLLPLIFGVIAGILSFLLAGNLRSRDPLGIIILVLFIYINKFLMPRFGIELKGKDWAGIGFMTFTAWYIIWTLLLNL
jgi:hypothetical protein